MRKKKKSRNIYKRGGSKRTKSKKIKKLKW